MNNFEYFSLFWTVNIVMKKEFSYSLNYNTCLYTYLYVKEDNRKGNIIKMTKEKNNNKYSTKYCMILNKYNKFF